MRKCNEITKSQVTQLLLQLTLHTTSLHTKYHEVAIFTLLIFKFFSCTQYVLNVKGSDEINSVE